MFRPLNDRVVIRKLDSQEITRAGLVLPDSVRKTRNAIGEVLYVGDGMVSPQTGVAIEMKVKPGDVVLFHPAAGAPVELENEPAGAIILGMLDIWGVLESDQKPEN